MSRTCPNCNMAIDIDIDICPHCDYHFKAEQVIANKAKGQKSNGTDGFPCPFCKREITEFHEICPHCDADLTAGSIVTTRFNWRLKDTSRKGLVVCPSCQHPTPAERTYCVHCHTTFPFERKSESVSDSVQVQETRQTRIEKQQRAESKARHTKLYFPPGCITPLETEQDLKLLDKIRSIPVDKAPKAILSSSDGQNVFHLIPGGSFFLGRQADVCHVPSVLFPEQAYRDQNSNVSRIHCQIIIRGNRCHVKDLSKNGTFLFKKQISFNSTIAIADGDEIWISDILGLKVSIYTDGRTILSIRLDRIQNQVGEHYILAPGPIPIGKKATLPIRANYGPDEFGFIYYDPEESNWFLTILENGRNKEVRALGVVDELECDGQMFSFYAL